MRTRRREVVAAPKLKDIEALCATKGMRLTEQPLEAEALLQL